MINIERKQLSKTEVVLTVSGRLDAGNSPLLERKIKQCGSDITELILDFSELEYISSMGLRVLLQAQKALRKEYRLLTVKNINYSIRKVFEMTGFLNLMLEEEKFVVVRRDEPSGEVLSLNGQMEADNAPSVATELTEIKYSKKKPVAKESALNRTPEVPEYEPANITLNLENLKSISPKAARLLKQAIADTDWEKRTLTVKNVPAAIQAVLEEAGITWITE